MKRRKIPTRLASLLLALSLLLPSCGGGASATAMHLRKTEGTVGVSDDAGKDVAPKDDLGLYSGYQVETQMESYAWIDLDEVKLTKMDADSEIEIAKEGKKLEINVKSGSLFFNVTEPLADDESMNIRTSIMAVGIRGTCGWVTQDTAALLEGTVEVTAGDQTVTVTAGEMAVVTEDGALEVKPITAASVPAFVREEVAEDEDLAAGIQDTTGIDLTGADPLAVYADLLAEVGKTGDIVYTGSFDFESDGDPELLVILNEHDLQNCAQAVVFLNGPEGPFKSYTYGWHIDNETVSMVESGGQLFIKRRGAVVSGDNENESIHYCEINCEDGAWIYRESTQYIRLNGQVNYFYEGLANYSHSNPADFQRRDISAGEYEAVHEKYTHVCDLVVGMDDIAVAVGNP